jgi:hypothetical protein
LPAFYAATARIDNRAVFEVPDLLADLLTPPAHAPRAAPAFVPTKRVDIDMIV